jgi:hypothetical protein
VIPALASAATSGAGTPSSAKVVADAGGLGLLCWRRGARVRSLSKAGKESLFRSWGGGIIGHHTSVGTSSLAERCTTGAP